MKIVLINPPDISVVKGFSSKGGIFFGVPLGLAYIAAVLERASFDVEIIDCPGLSNERTFGWDQICKTLEKSTPDLVGITTTTPTLISAIELAKKSKDFFPEVPVILGGHGTFTIERTILERVKEVDVIVCREGEETIVELANAYKKGQSLVKVKGICLRSDKEIIKTSSRGFIRDLDSLPFPARHLLPMRSYIKPHGLLKIKRTTLVTSRGCPFSCVFCASSTFWGHKFRGRSPKNVVDELQQLYEDFEGLGLKGFYFGDDNFTVDKKRVMKICDLIILRGLSHLRWSCQARVDCADSKLFRKMHEAGCRCIEFGVESGSDSILRLIGKGITTNMVRHAVKMAKDACLKVHGNFIIGLPGDTPNTMKQTLEFSEELKLDSSTFAPALVYPSTELARHKDIDWLTFLLEEEVENPVSLGGFSNFFHPCVPTYLDRNLMREVIKKIAIRRMFRSAIKMRWLLHPIQTCQRSYELIRIFLHIK